MRNMLSLLGQETNTLASSDLSYLVRTFGICVGSPDPDAWFPPEPTVGGNVSAEALAVRRANYEDTAGARCAGCPVLAECLELALREEGNLPRTWIHGIRGGTAPWRRLNMIQSRKRRTARQAAQAVSA
jgi:hypothetical protein